MKILITGACGLVGSALVERFCRAGHEVVGVDNDGRREFFGDIGSTEAAGDALKEKFKICILSMDVRHVRQMDLLFMHERPGAVVHCAAQPSHDWAAKHPLQDFQVNALGTLNVLQSCRSRCPEAPFVFMSTNKVYGDGINSLAIDELETRIEFSVSEPFEGISERFPIGASSVSLYGAGKLAADVYAQEYGRYYGMRTVCLRAGCITGAGHAAVPAHGFLSYLVKCNVARERYTIKGYGGKQVRDNLHAADLARLIDMIIQRPPERGAVYNVGGGRANSCSIREAMAAIEEITGWPVFHEHDPEPRKGDHACYYTDLSKVMRDYPGWRVERDLPSIYAELVKDWRARLG